MLNPKTYLAEILDYYKYKLDNNLCTMEEMNSLAKTIQENMEIQGTISDFAQFYNQSESSIRATISRKLLAKPKRKVFYPFHTFARIVSDKWHKKK
jgi:hypothetical protein